MGTVQLEFFGLAHHSGEGHFREKAQRVIDLLDQNGGPLTDGGRLWPIHVRPETGASTGSQVSWGAMGDSYYEYLIKAHLMTGEHEYLVMFQQAYGAVKAFLSRHPWYVDVNMDTANLVWPVYNSLQSFWPGL